MRIPDWLPTHEMARLQASPSPAEPAVQVRAGGPVSCHPGPYGAPLSGPLTDVPQVTQLEAEEMLDRAVHGLPLGSADQELLGQLQGLWPPSAIAVLASLIARCRREQH